MKALVEISKKRNTAMIPVCENTAMTEFNDIQPLAAVKKKASIISFYCSTEKTEISEVDPEEMVSNFEYN